MDHGASGSPKLELKLNLSPPHKSGSSTTEVSPRSSCVSREASPDEVMRPRCPSSPESGPMTLVGCPRCLMYVIVLMEDLKCPKCKSTVLLDFLHQEDDDNNNRRDNK